MSPVDVRDDKEERRQMHAYSHYLLGGCDCDC